MFNSKKAKQTNMKKIFVKPEIVVTAIQCGNMLAASINGFRAVQDNATSDYTPVGGGNGSNDARRNTFDDILY